MSCFVTANWIENFTIKMFLVFVAFKFSWIVVIVVIVAFVVVRLKSFHVDLFLRNGKSARFFFPRCL